MRWTPINIGRLSCLETAITVWLITCFKISLGICKLWVAPTSGKWGKLSGSTPLMENSVEPEVILVIKRLGAVSIVIVSAGNFLTISLKNLAGNATEPSSKICKLASSSAIEIIVSIEISALLPVKVKPSENKSNLILRKISRVTFEEIARWTSVRYLINAVRWTENFIVILLFIIIYII